MANKKKPKNKASKKNASQASSYYFGGITGVEKLPVFGSSANQPVSYSELGQLVAIILT